ncbi:uncharacterized protein LOC141664594 [Apium graveolens]|uniref:uncharacterized protein LOC141664594 n=1 Tax=Apium graveolens TaxID=4045 RepID=UPI003D7B4FBB
MTASLVNIRQRLNESLREYINRFRAETIQIPDLIEYLTLTYLVAGVDRSRHNLLLEEFFEKSPVTLQTTINLFEHRLTLQEVVGNIEATRSPGRRNSRSTERSSQWDYRKGGRRSEKEPYRAAHATDKLEEKPVKSSEDFSKTRISPVKQRSWPPRPREERDFTKLSIDKTHILAILKASPGYIPPRPMNPNRPPSNKFCDYHEDTGHTTKRCYQLKYLIEDEVQNGELAHFVAKEDSSLHQQYDQDRVIDFISGGQSAGGNSNRSRKSYAREIFRVESKKPKRNPSPIIFFSDEDYGDRVIEDHQDALVITTKIGTNTVQKIIVDNGSSVDILYHSAFKRMDIGDRKLKDALDAPLYGFTGNEVKVVGMIDLPVLFGSPPCQTWLNSTS